MLIVGFVVMWCPIIFVLLYLIFNYMIRGKNSVCIVVLGDIGRSPRMQYHASSFGAEGFVVDIVGYGGLYHSTTSFFVFLEWIKLKRLVII